MPRRPVIPPKLPTSTRQAKLCWTPLRTGRQPRVHNNSLWPGHHVPTGGYLQNVASETSVLHQLTLSACRCRCRRAPDSLGDHGSACAQARLCAQKKCCRSLPRSVAASGKMTEKSRAMDRAGARKVSVRYAVLLRRKQPQTEIQLSPAMCWLRASSRDQPPAESTPGAKGQWLGVGCAPGTSGAAGNQKEHMHGKCR